MLALEGIRILDLTRLVPGPYATMLLSDLGAEVIKVEEPQGGDYLRSIEPRYRETNVAFSMLHRGKKSVTLNLKDPEGQERFLGLAKTADVLVESYRPGVMDRLGLGYSAVSAIQPGMVYCSLTGYGQTGPLRDLPGHDVNYLSYAGVLGATGPAGGPPALPGVLVADIGGGAMTAVFAILAALLARQRGGGGQHLDVSMVDALRPWMLIPALPHFAGALLPERGRFPLSGGLPVYGVYETKDQKWVSIALLEPKFLAAFVEKAGIPVEETADRAKMEALFKKRTQAEWGALGDLPMAPVLTVEEAVRDHITWVEDPCEGRVAHLPFPVRFSRTPARAPSRAPRLGEHTAEVLGLRPSEFDQLGSRGVV